METKNYQEKEKMLREKSFSPEFKQGKEWVINTLQVFEKQVDYFNVYEDGEIISVEVEMDDKNKETLSKLICDFESYQELVALGYEVSDGKIDLIGIIDFSKDVLNQQVLYDREKQEFFLQEC